MSEPTPYELWKQAGEDGARYRELMIEHGLLIPLKPGEKAEPLPCGWPRRSRGWWLCPNDPPCPHGGAVHDVYDADDPLPRCCMEGCDCGKVRV